MRGHLAYAQGSPSATLVLSAADFPGREQDLPLALEPVRDWMLRSGAEKVTKVALIAPSRTPGCEIDYRFVQLLPGQRLGIELHGSCGHSILAALLVAARHGWTAPLGVGRTTQVNVVNNGDRVLCEVERAAPPDYTISAHFLRIPPVVADELLLTGEPVTAVVAGPPYARPVPVSLVSAGNAYAFVDARDLGVPDADRLFADDPALFEAMASLRRAVVERLGWPPAGVFPKIAALLCEGPGRLAARAISVPSWHPTIALTGAVCLAAAAGIAGTIPARLAYGQRTSGAPPAEVRLRIHTPGGVTEVFAQFDRDRPAGALLRVGVQGKLVRDLGPVEIPATVGVAR